MTYLNKIYKRKKIMNPFKKLLNLFKSNRGKLIKIENKNHKLGEILYYYRLEILTETNEKEILLFTETEIKNAKIRSIKNPEDIQ